MKFPFLRFTFALAVLAAVPASFAEEPAAAPIVSEDFENVAVGGIPQGFTKAGKIAVADDESAHTGKHSLRIEPVTKGIRTISLSPEKLAALGGQFWGRLYYKVKSPSPLPVIPPGKAYGIIHSTIVSGKALSPLDKAPIDVRLAGTVTDMQGAFRYLYNVQPAKAAGRKEFGGRAKAKSFYSDGWTLLEWSVDHATQSYQFFLNGQEVPELTVNKGAGQFAGAEIPEKFTSLSIGWTNYQPTENEGFTVWIDDLALSKTRLGPVEVKTAAAAEQK